MSDYGSLHRLVLLLGCLALLSACAPRGIYHTVQPGQTLYSIARAYNVEEGRLARINRISDPKKLRAHQKLYVPGVSQLRKVPATSVAPKVSRSSRPATAPPKAVVAKSPPAQKPAVKKPQSRTSTATKPVKGLFVWPVKGKVLNSFGAKNQKVSKGIEISVPRGTAVVAAASGKVIYSGSGIPGYGNLVILEHSDDYFSVYGYNQTCLVKQNDHVGQGEKIALSGAPQNGQSARLHFEIRKGKSAVNPILYLP